MELAKAESLTFGVGKSDAHAAERALVEAAQRGDDGAFAELVRMYDRSVLRIALRVLRSQEDAREAYQEAFLRVYRKLHTFRFQCRFHTWVYRIATNVCLDQLRRRKARPEYTAIESKDGDGWSVFARAAAPDPISSPDRVLHSREIAQRIEDALDDLSDRERMVFTLRHHEGMRLRAIANMCSMSEESAKQCLFRGTRKLRKRLKDLRG